MIFSPHMEAEAPKRWLASCPYSISRVHNTRVLFNSEVKFASCSERNASDTCLDLHVLCDAHVRMACNSELTLLTNQPVLANRSIGCGLGPGRPGRAAAVWAVRPTG
jgi:hypothetical protein